MISLDELQKVACHGLGLGVVGRSEQVVVVEAVIEIVERFASGVSTSQGKRVVVGPVLSRVEAAEERSEGEIGLPVAAIATRIEKERVAPFIEGGIARP